MHVPEHVYNEMAKFCRCCEFCGQQIPCDGVMSGQMCDGFCDCDEIERAEEEIDQDDEIWWWSN